MKVLLSCLDQSVFVVLVACFALYVPLELGVLLISHTVGRRKSTGVAQPVSGPGDAFSLPGDVLLSICNESVVVTRLIDAACRLRCPLITLDMLVLDDSSETTSALAQDTPVRLVRRGRRKSECKGVSPLCTSAREILSRCAVVYRPRRPFEVCEPVLPIRLVEALTMAKPVIGPVLPVFRHEMGAKPACWFIRSGETADMACVIGMALAGREALAAYCARERIYAATQRRCQNSANEVLRLCA